MGILYISFYFFSPIFLLLGSLYSGITNQDGVVNFNVSINYETSFTCTYGNANATCTVLRHLYNPVFDGTEETVTLTDGYVFKVENLNGTVWAGNYHQCGRLKEGWDNSTDWVCTMTLQTSYWDGGFVMLLYPYETQTCTQYGYSTWDCIFNNGQNDCLFFCDGQLRVNTGSSWSNVGIGYSRGSTFTAKFVKQGNTLSYYENDNLKGSFTMNKLLTAEKIYIGTLTWGGSGSVNRFKDVVVDKS